MSRKKIESKTIIGQRIRDIRCQKNMTQKDLAMQSGIGLSRLKLYESGDSIPSTDAVIGIASALDCALLDICKDTEFSNDTINQIFETATQSIAVNELDQSVIDLLAFYSGFGSPNVAEFINALHKYNGREIVRIMGRIQSMMERIENTEKQDHSNGMYLPDDATSVRIATEEWFEYYGSMLGYEVAKAIKAWAMDKFDISE